MGKKGKSRTEPSGRIVPIRLSRKDTLESGAEVEMVIAGRGIIAHVHSGNSDERRQFKLAAKSLGVVMNACETSFGKFADNGKTVVVENLPSAFECVGSRESLLELVKHPLVARWHYPLSVPVFGDCENDFEMTKRWACGAGPEKIRSAPSSAFGKPNQVKATAVTLAKATADAVKLLLKEAE